MQLDLSISNVIISSNKHDRCDYFKFDVVFLFLFLDGDSHRAYISSCSVSKVFSYINDFNNRKKVLISKRFIQGYRCRIFRKVCGFQQMSPTYQIIVTY